MVASDWRGELKVQYIRRGGRYEVDFTDCKIRAGHLLELRAEVALYLSPRLGKTYDYVYDHIEFI